MPVRRRRHLVCQAWARERVIQNAHLSAECIRVGSPSRESGDEVEVAGVEQGDDRIFAGVRIEISDDQCVEVAASRRVCGEPARQCLRGVRPGLVAVALPVADVGVVEIATRRPLRLEVIDGEREEPAVLELEEALRDARPITSGEGRIDGNVQDGGVAHRQDGVRVVDEPHRDRIAAEVERGEVDEAVRPVRGCCVQAGDELLDRPWGSIRGNIRRTIRVVVLDLHERQHIGIELRDRRHDLVVLAVELRPRVGAPSRREAAPTTVAVEIIQYVDADDAQRSDAPGRRAAARVRAMDRERLDRLNAVVAETIVHDAGQGLDDVATPQCLDRRETRRLRVPDRVGILAVRAVVQNDSTAIVGDAPGERHRARSLELGRAEQPPTGRQVDLPETPEVERPRHGQRRRETDAHPFVALELFHEVEREAGERGSHRRSRGTDPRSPDIHDGGQRRARPRLQLPDPAPQPHHVAELCLPVEATRLHEEAFRGRRLPVSVSVLLLQVDARQLITALEITHHDRLDDHAGPVFERAEEPRSLDLVNSGRRRTTEAGILQR